MKKLLTLLLCFVMLFALVACGGGESTDVSSEGGSTSANTNEMTAISFDKEKYIVGIDKYLSIVDSITVEPAGAEITYTVSDETVCTVSKDGEVTGLKSGQTTLVAGSSDGRIVATCTINVVGFGTLIGYDENYDGYTKSHGVFSVGGGIRNKRVGTAPEMNLDTNARVLIIPQEMSEDVDMTGAAKLDYGPKNSDGWFYKFFGNIESGEGYIVAKTDEVAASFEVENVPEGKYYALIASSRDYTQHKTYNPEYMKQELKSSDIGKWFTDSQIGTLATSIGDREYAVVEIEVKANEKYYFEHIFFIN